MRQATRNYVLVVILLLLGIVEVVSGFVLWLVLGVGQGYMGGKGSALEATSLWSRGTWIDMHTVVGVILVVVVVIHLILHRKWILRMTKRLVVKETN